MNVFLFSLLKNLLLGAIGLYFPPLYFLLRRKFGVALLSVIFCVWGGKYLTLLCAGLVVVSVLTQIIVDYRFRYVIADNFTYAWQYRIFDWMSQLLSGQRLLETDTQAAYEDSSGDIIARPRPHNSDGIS